MTEIESEKYDCSIRSELDKQDLPEILTRVLKYAVWITTVYYWLGLKPVELVQEAVARAYGVGTGGTYRNWNPKKCTLTTFLKGTIRSIASHRAEHESDIVRVPLINEEGSVKVLSPSPFALVSIDALEPDTPERLMEKHEEEVEENAVFQNLVQRLDSIANEDEDLGYIILALKDGYSRPREIASETGLEVEKVYKLLARLRRTIKNK